MNINENMRKLKRFSVSVATVALVSSLVVSPANAQNNIKPIEGDCSPSTGCVTDGRDRWQAPMPPPLNEEEQRLWDQCQAQVIAAGLTGVAGGLAWLGAVGQLGAAGIGPCQEAHDKYQQRMEEEKNNDEDGD